MEQPSDTLWVGDLPGTIDEEQVKAVLGVYGNVVRVKMLNVSNGKAACIAELDNISEAKFIVENLNGNVPQGLSQPIVVRFKKNQGQSYVEPSFKPNIVGGNFGKANGSTTGGDGLCPYGSPARKGSDYGSQAGKGSGYSCQAGIGGGAGKGESGIPWGTTCDIRTLLVGLKECGTFPTVAKEEIAQLYIAGLPRDTTDLELYQLFTPFGCPIAWNGVKAMIGNDGMCTGSGFVDVMDYVSAERAMNALHGTVMPDGKLLKVQFKRTRAAAECPALPPVIAAASV